MYLQRWPWWLVWRYTWRCWPPLWTFGTTSWAGTALHSLSSTLYSGLWQSIIIATQKDTLLIGDWGGSPQVKMTAVRRSVDLLNVYLDKLKNNINFVFKMSLFVNVFLHRLYLVISLIILCIIRYAERFCMQTSIDQLLKVT